MATKPETDQVVEQKVVEKPTQAPTQTPTQAPTAPPTEAPAKVQVSRQPAPAVTSFEDKIRRIKMVGTLAEKTLVEQLETYAKQMAPGIPVQGDLGARIQYGLHRTLMSVIDNGGEEFNNLWNIVLSYFFEYRKGVFDDYYVFRFAEYWGKTQEELNCFHRVLNLIMLSCDPKTRGQNVAKQVDFQRTMSQGFSDRARQNILRFYQV